MIITVGGQAASGKTTLAAALAERLGFAHISAGKLMREMAAESDMTLVEFSEYAKSHPEVDKEIDARQKKLAGQGDCVVDGRLSRFFLDPDLSIWLIAPSQVRASRVVGRGEEYATVGQAKADMDARDELERQRYIDFYSIDLSDLSSYDLVIDTERFNIPAMTELALSAVELVRG